LLARDAGPVNTLPSLIQMDRAAGLALVLRALPQIVDVDRVASLAPVRDRLLGVLGRLLDVPRQLLDRDAVPVTALHGLIQLNRAAGIVHRLSAPLHLVGVAQFASLVLVRHRLPGILGQMLDVSRRLLVRDAAPVSMLPSLIQMDRAAGLVPILHAPLQLVAVDRVASLVHVRDRLLGVLGRLLNVLRQLLHRDADPVAVLHYLTQLDRAAGRIPILNVPLQLVGVVQVASLVLVHDRLPGMLDQLLDVPRRPLDRNAVPVNILHSLIQMGRAAGHVLILHVLRHMVDVDRVASFVLVSDRLPGVLGRLLGVLRQLLDRDAVVTCEAKADRAVTWSCNSLRAASRTAGVAAAARASAR